jgi:hypothetical protein
MHWFKIHHGYSSDSKLALVAHRHQIPRATINGIFLELLEYASKQEERGSLIGYNIEAGAFSMGITQELLNDVIVTLRNVTLVTCEKVVNWDKYQGGGDSTAAERQRRHRNKKKQEVGKVSRDSNVTSPLRNVDKSRIEKKEYTVKMPFAEFPKEWKEWTIAETTLSGEPMNDTWLSFREYWLVGKGKNAKREDWFLTWRKWCEKYRNTASPFAKPKPARAGVRTLGGRNEQ